MRKAETNVMKRTVQDAVAGLEWGIAELRQVLISPRPEEASDRLNKALALINSAAQRVERVTH